MRAALKISQPQNGKKQKGNALFVVLIVLVLTLFGALAFFKSTETTAMLAGNMAFRQATKQASDIGVGEAFTFVSSLSTPNVDQANRYFALRQTEDAYGIPNTVNWSSVASTTVGNYSVQYVVDRMCSGTLPITDITRDCMASTLVSGDSKKKGAPVFSSVGTVIYRATVRTTGPKNAEAYTQVLIVR